MTRKSDREAEAAFVGMYGARPKTKYYAPPPAGMPLEERLRWTRNGVQAARESSREKTNWEKAADRAIRRARSSAPAMPEHVFQKRVTSGMERQVPGWGKMTRAERHAKLKELAGIGQKRVEGVAQTPYGQIGDQVQFPEGTKLDIGTLGEKLQRGNRTRKQTKENPVNAANHPPSQVVPSKVKKPENYNDFGWNERAAAPLPRGTTRSKQQSAGNHPHSRDPDFAQVNQIINRGTIQDVARDRKALTSANNEVLQQEALRQRSQKQGRQAMYASTGDPKYLQEPIEEEKKAGQRFKYLSTGNPKYRVKM